MRIKNIWWGLAFSLCSSERGVDLVCVAQNVKEHTCRLFPFAAFSLARGRFVMQTIAPGWLTGVPPCWRREVWGATLGSGDLDS